jgi:hypothetical protein
VKNPLPQGTPVSGPERLQWLNENLASLVDACPQTKNNPADCPLCEVRKLGPEAISTWLDGLRAEEKEYLMLYHQCCLVIRWETAHGKKPAPGRIRRRSKRARGAG